MEANRCHQTWEVNKCKEDSHLLFHNNQWCSEVNNSQDHKCSNNSDHHKTEDHHSNNSNKEDKDHHSKINKEVQDNSKTTWTIKEEVSTNKIEDHNKEVKDQVVINKIEVQTQIEVQTNSKINNQKSRLHQHQNKKLCHKLHMPI